MKISPFAGKPADPSLHLRRIQEEAQALLSHALAGSHGMKQEASVTTALLRKISVIPNGRESRR